jgi:phosphopantetheine--protein transferase-like protein
MAVGVDIEDIERFKGKPKSFIGRVFTPVEIEYCTSFANPESHFAVRFCAKEAVIKALTALNIKGVNLSEIEIYHNENKCPQVRILKKVEKNIIFNLSLSHDRTKAIAFVTAEEY